MPGPPKSPKGFSAAAFCGDSPGGRASAAAAKEEAEEWSHLDVRAFLSRKSLLLFCFSSFAAAAAAAAAAPALVLLAVQQLELLTSPHMKQQHQQQQR
ncbi:hypothetical protein ACSSS7_002047 [Eimeria intestinalis]